MKILGLAFVFALIVLTNAVNAGVISITTRADTVFMIGPSAELNVTVSNSGDEPAYDVKISLLLPDGFSSESMFAGRIDEGSNYTALFAISSGGKKSGEYAFAILVEYKDANRYPFSAVSPNAIIYNSPSDRKSVV